MVKISFSREHFVTVDFGPQDPQVYDVDPRPTHVRRRLGDLRDWWKGIWADETTSSSRRSSAKGNPGNK